MKSNRWLNHVLLYSPVLLCGLVMLPRLLSPQFGFFDDPSSLLNAQHIQQGEWSILDEAAAGRFRPMYWLYFALIYALANGQALSPQLPIWFFLGNLLLWGAITALLIHLARSLGMDRKSAWVTGMSFVLAGPVLENVYTLSKPELQQAFWMLAAISASALFRRASTWFWKIAAFTLPAFLVLLACLTKETGVLLALFAGIAWVIHGLGRYLAKQAETTAIAQRAAFLLQALLGALVYLGLRWYVSNTGLAAQGYADNFSFSLIWLFSKFRLWVDWLLRDFLYLLPMALTALLIVWRKAYHSKIPFLLESLAWIAIWVGVYIPWVYTQEYYLLPMSLGAAVLCGQLFSLNWDLLQSKTALRFTAVVGYAVSGLLLLALIPSLVTNARLQLALDHANAQMLEYLVNHTAPGSQVWINIQEPNEYYERIQTWVQVLKGRSDLEVDYFHFQDLETARQDGRPVWIVSPYMENQFFPSVRMGIFEHMSRLWNESLFAYLNEQGQDTQPAQAYREAFRSFNVDPLRFFCPLTPDLGYCDVPNAPADRRVFAYGWLIYPIPAD